MPTVGFFAGHDHDTWEKLGAKGVRTDLEKDGVYEEFDGNFLIAKGAVELLRKHSDLKVLFPQADKRRMTLKERTDYLNANNVDFFEDIHANAAASRTATGAAAFYWHSSEKSKRAAQLYADFIKGAGLPVWSGGKYASNSKDGWSGFHMLKASNMPGILTENFFFTTRSDLEKYLLNAKVIRTLQYVHANIALAYFGKPLLSMAESPQVPLPNNNYVLKLGHTGDSVRYLQSRLNKHGFALIIDGGFGELTDKAVKTFQKQKGLVVDGVVGAATWAELEKEPVKIPDTPKKTETVKAKEETKVEYEKFAVGSPKLAPEFEKAVKNQITDGTYPTRPMTRQEGAVMNNRVYEKVMEEVRALLADK